jgi:hypothetical protein
LIHDPVKASTVLSRPHGSNREKLCYAAPYHVHLNGTGSNSHPDPHLFIGAASGPHNLLHHDTVSGYGLAASTVIHLQPQHGTTTTTTVRMHRLRGKLGIGSTLGPFLSIFVHPNIVTRPLPLHTIKGEGGTLDKTRWTMPSNDNVLSIHSNTRTHTHT